MAWVYWQEIVFKRSIDAHKPGRASVKPPRGHRHDFLITHCSDPPVLTGSFIRSCQSTNPFCHDLCFSKSVHWILCIWLNSKAKSSIPRKHQAWPPTSPGEAHQAQPRRKAFVSVVALSLWNIIPMEGGLAPTLILFHKAPNAWVCQWAWLPQRGNPQMTCVTVAAMGQGVIIFLIVFHIGFLFL